jgi:hypothetical protein
LGAANFLDASGAGASTPAGTLGGEALIGPEQSSDAPLLPVAR